MGLSQQALMALFGGTALAAVLAFLAVLSRKGRTEDTARAYLAGVRYVLSDDPDAAIAELSRAAQLDSETLDTYFALGALFRRKGELERAIRLHRNILLRPGLSAEVKRRAQLSLAIDYKGAGISDKAIEACEKLLADEPDHVEALTRLRQLLESTGDFARALEVQAKLCKIEGRGEDVLAHHLAQLSRQAEPDEALSLTERAISLCPSSADARLARGEALVRAGRASEAGPSLEAAITLEPEVAPRAVKALAAALEPAALEALLRGRIAAAGPSSAAYELALALHWKDTGRRREAISLLRQLTERAPRRWEARKELGALLLAEDRSEELRADYQGILATLGQPALAFVCSQCRQSLPEHLFRCPACESWDAVRRESAQPARPAI